MKNKTISRCCTLLFILAVACGSLLQAQNSTLSVQGVLRKSDGAAVSDGTYSLTFRLWDAATNGTAVHTETQTNVQVTGGIYSTLLGTATAMTAPFDKSYYLGVTVGSGQELIPRAQLSSAPYTLAIRGQSNVVPSNGSVGVGTLQPKSKLDVEGGLSVGANYSGTTAAPANGAIIEGNVGIGTSGPQSKLDVEGSLAVGATYSGTTAAPANGAIIEGNVGIGTSAPKSKLDVEGGLAVGATYSGTTAAPTNGAIIEGRVGIGGTPDPTQKLHVYNTGYGIAHESDGVKLSTYIQVDPGGTTAGYFGTRSNHDLRFYVNDNNGSLIVRKNGNVEVPGLLAKGGGSFKIDHPLDPANKFLYHSFVESPDMMNVYNGNIITDNSGLATVELPDYFMKLNRDFRYQLTVIGAFAQAIIKEKVSNNRFVIETSVPNIEVSWQITGIRQDPYANQNRIPNSVDKTPEEKGYYLHPKAYGLSEKQGIQYQLKAPNAKTVEK
ncbi:MAG: hypothetical protein IT260_21550 [Saprospiraceae bacterium]|nr:hypothetical protein [Saprospiraceae bacterium]